MGKRDKRGIKVEERWVKMGKRERMEEEGGREEQMDWKENKKRNKGGRKVKENGEERE